MSLEQGTFTAFDFETAIGFNHRTVCQAGIVLVENFKIKKGYSYLIKPPGNDYAHENIELHGITSEMTAEKETFDKVFPLFSEHIVDKICVAHNMPFDYACIQKSLELYGMDPIYFEAHCTKKIYRKTLKESCNLNGITTLGAHNALNDATACANLFIKYLKHIYGTE